MAITTIYLQTAWGDSSDTVTMEEIRKAIATTKTMGEDHGAFWVGILIDPFEVVLEVHKDLTVIGVFPGAPNEEVMVVFPDWTEVEALYEVFLTRDFRQVRRTLESKED